jgi:hypothetical protein
MSKISTIVDNIGTELATLLGATHKEIVDPILIEANDTLYLRRGYGYVMGAGENSDRQLGCQLSVERDVIITNTIAIHATKSDITAYRAAWKTLLEDQLLIIDLMEKNPTINSVTAKMAFISDNGIEPIFNDKREAFLMIQSIFSFEYFEDLT